MAVELYAHQLEAIGHLKCGSILCGGVGTGKSRTALAYYYKVICKGTLPFRKCRSFGRKKNVPLYIITTARKRDTHEWDEEAIPFLLSDYVVDSWNNIKKYENVKNSFFIFDEQRLVGNGAWVKAFLNIAKSNEWILLSATPGDTWMDYIPVMIANGFYRNRTEFIRRHVVYSPYSKYPKVMRYLDTERLEKIRNSILVNMTYEKKAVKHDLWVKVGYDADRYSKVFKDRWNIYEEAPVKNISELCYTMRKVVNSDERRMEALNHIFEKHPKLIIFYNFDYELELLRKNAESKGICYAEWNGHKHELIPSEKAWLYFVQYSAGAEGWNCVETDAMIFYSQSYSYKTMHQASGRIDRMNTPYTNLYYYHLFSEAPIDRAIKQCVNKKKDFNEQIFLA